MCAKPDCNNPIAPPVTSDGCAVGCARCSTVTQNTTRSDIISRVKRTGVKWSADAVKNVEVLSDPTRLITIIDDMASSVSKLKSDNDNVIHNELFGVILKYSKSTDRSYLEEMTSCISRPLVVKCNITESLPDIRKLMTTILFDYDVSLESHNSTEIAHVVKDEIVDAVVVDAVNLTVTSDQVLLDSATSEEKAAFDELSSQSFNVSDDEVFTFDAIGSNDIYVTDMVSDDTIYYLSLIHISEH